MTPPNNQFQSLLFAPPEKRVHFTAHNEVYEVNEAKEKRHSFLNGIPSPALNLTSQFFKSIPNHSHSLKSLLPARKESIPLPSVDTLCTPVISEMEPLLLPDSLQHKKKKSTRTEDTLLPPPVATTTTKLTNLTDIPNLRHEPVPQIMEQSQPELQKEIVPRLIYKEDSSIINKKIEDINQTGDLNHLIAEIEHKMNLEKQELINMMKKQDQIRTAQLEAQGNELKELLQQLTLQQVRTKQINEGTIIIEQPKQGSESVVKYISKDSLTEIEKDGNTYRIKKNTNNNDNNNNNEIDENSTQENSMNRLEAELTQIRELFDNLSNMKITHFQEHINLSPQKNININETTSYYRDQPSVPLATKSPIHNKFSPSFSFVFSQNKSKWI